MKYLEEQGDKDLFLCRNSDYAIKLGTARYLVSAWWSRGEKRPVAWLLPSHQCIANTSQTCWSNEPRALDILTGIYGVVPAAPPQRTLSRKVRVRGSWWSVYVWILSVTFKFWLVWVIYKIGMCTVDIIQYNNSYDSRFIKYHWQHLKARSNSKKTGRGK